MGRELREESIMNIDGRRTMGKYRVDWNVFSLTFDSDLYELWLQIGYTNRLESKNGKLSFTGQTMKADLWGKHGRAAPHQRLTNVSGGTGDEIRAREGLPRPSLECGNCKQSEHCVRHMVIIELVVCPHAGNDLRPLGVVIFVRDEEAAAERWALIRWQKYGNVQRTVGAVYFNSKTR